MRGHSARKIVVSKGFIAGANWFPTRLLKDVLRWAKFSIMRRKARSQQNFTAHKENAFTVKTIFDDLGKL